jgi:hypothetical protein
LRRAKTLLIAAALMAPAAGGAQTPAGYHTHDGYFMSLDLGAGWGALHSEKQEPFVKSTLDLSGPGSIVDMKFGGTPHPNLCVSGDIMILTVAGPKAELDGANLGTIDSVETRELLLGMGATYYFMPANIFVGGMLGGGGFRIRKIRGGADEAGSNQGFGFQLKAGKEWWVSGNWALGVSAVFMDLFVNNSQTSQGLTEEQHIRGPVFGLLFNSTLN